MKESQLRLDHVRSLTLTSAHYRSFSSYRILHWVCPQISTDLSALSRLMVATVTFRPLISWDHSRYPVSPVPVTLAPTTWGIRSPICSADFKLQGYPTGDPITGLKISHFLGRDKGKQCCYFGSHLSQNWHMFFLIQPTTKQ